MSTNVIYHNFRKEPAGKEGYFLKIASRINAALNDACVFLCGACAGFCVLVILMLALFS